MFAKNSAPTLSAPVPLKHWIPKARPSLNETDSAPSTIRVAAVARGSYPSTGKYSLFSVWSARIHKRNWSRYLHGNMFSSNQRGVSPFRELQGVPTVFLHLSGRLFKTKDHSFNLQCFLYRNKNRTSETHLQHQDWLSGQMDRQHKPCSKQKLRSEEQSQLNWISRSPWSIGN